MIIFGTTSRRKTVDEGEFYCPQCAAKREYALKRAKRYFSVYFIPLIPMDDMGEYVECMTCHNMFSPDILHYKPAQRPVSAAELMNAIDGRLTKGDPVELIVRDLTVAGIDRDVALKTVRAYLGDTPRTCKDCGLTYASSISHCTECNKPLEPSAN